MVCPYNRKNQTNIIQWKQEYNEDGQAYFLTQISKDSFELMDCKREECGAWHNGRCHYASVSMENE
jgi:hypothetical protein